MKNIVLCVDLREDCLNALKTVGKKIELKQAKIHLIHAFEIQAGVMEFATFVYPTEEQYPEIEKSVNELLNSLQKDLGLSDDQVEKHCMFTHSKESTVKDYLDSKKADLVVLSTRGKHGIQGFFASSLADYLCKYSPCDVLVMRPNQ
jgi:nucleotide-binding universal stress UspA family protein